VRILPGADVPDPTPDFVNGNLLIIIGCDQLFISSKLTLDLDILMPVSACPDEA
jgi:hypothetical protein